MNPVRILRQHTGVTQEVLAIRAGTSQPTIAAYETGAKSPTLATLQRLAWSLGLELTVTLTPKMTREDRRSLAYHQAIAKKLKRDSGPVIERARQNLLKMTKQHPDAKALIDQWNLWIEQPTDELISRILDPGLLARDMRQVTPFAGVLEPGERAQVLKQFQKGYCS